jgi:hypothetical protein
MIHLINLFESLYASQVVMSMKNQKESEDCGHLSGKYYVFGGDFLIGNFFMAFLLGL